MPYYAMVGALALYTFHVLAAPHAQHSIFGVTMGARVAAARRENYSRGTPCSSIA